MTAKKMTVNLAARFVDSLSADELQILANAKRAKETGTKAPKTETKPAQTENKGPAKVSLIAKAPNTRGNVMKAVLKCEEMEVEVAEGKTERMLALRTPGYNHGFRGFCYHEVEVLHGRKWVNRKIDGEWVKFIPVGDVELLLTGLKKSFSGARLEMDGKVIDL